jgi:hypothetical protein
MSGGRPGVVKTARVAAGGNYGGGQLSLVSEGFVLTTSQVLSMQCSVKRFTKSYIDGLSRHTTEDDDEH